MGERRGAYRVLVGKPEGRKPLGRPRRRWEDNIKMDLREVGCGGADWIDLAQDRDRWRALVYTVMNLRVPQNVGYFLSSLGHFSFSGRTLLHGVRRHFNPESLHYAVFSTFLLLPCFSLRSRNQVSSHRNQQVKLK
jgi:hypothetical protein